jgi:HTH-type transcriptional regulator/antitoxin HigA
MGMTEKDLSKILGYRIGPPSGGKSSILSGKRKLSLSMIRKLHEKLKIPAEVLIQDY